METRNGDFIGTYKGKKFYPLDPRIDEVDLEDIAHSLSLLCRYNGHVKRFYSVAEHCIHAADWLEMKGYGTEVALQGLLHDASEAYVSDVPKPIKRMLNGWERVEEKVQKTIFERFNVSWPMDEAIKEIDLRLLYSEANENFELSLSEWNLNYNPKFMYADCIDFLYLDPSSAESAYLETFERLNNER